MNERAAAATGAASDDGLRSDRDDLISILAAVELAIVVLSPELTIRRLSPHAQQVLKLSEADIGSSLRDVQHGFVVADAAFDLAAFVAAAIEDRTERAQEVRDRRGGWHLVRVCLSKTRDPRIEGAVMLLVDLGERRREEQAQARLAAIVASSDDAIISKDLQGILQTWNVGAERLFGYTAEEAIGNPATLLMPPDRINEEPGILARIGRGETVDHYETVRQRKDGSLVNVSLTISPIRDREGRIVGASKIARDITERTRLENALRQRSADLQQADDRKNEFLAMLGHELRNPLSALVYGLELQKNAIDDRDRMDELRKMMVRQSARISTLLDQLLDIARVISGKIVIANTPVDLADVVHAALETVHPQLDVQRHKLSVSVPYGEKAMVMGDAVRLSQVVENLLTNAIKYTDAGSHLAVAIEIANDTTKIIVRDPGIGMSADFLPHVFDVFTQAPRALDRAKGGLGLGLPLVKHLVELHGGTVEAKSPGLGQGCEFVVTLPRLLERASPGSMSPALTGSERPRAEAAEMEPARHKILIVDDEADLASSFAELLEDGGHRVLAVHDGPAALTAVRQFEPDLVLLDLGLPGMDGYEVATKLRAEHGEQKPFLVAVTGYQKDLTRLNAAGFDEHLLKPPTTRKLAPLLALIEGQRR
jgi:two-component system, chemotaxis family, CheB/CheR fusion protein